MVCYTKKKMKVEWLLCLQKIKYMLLHRTKDNCGCSVMSLKNLILTCSKWQITWHHQKLVKRI